MANGVVFAIWLYVAGAEKRTLSRAADFEKQGDWRSAGMLLEQAVLAHPERAPVARAWAEFLDRIGAPESIAAWRSVLKLAPTDDLAWLRLAAAAMRLGDLDLVEDALARVSDAAKATTDYHRLGAGLGLARGHRTAAGRHLKALLALDPTSPRFRFMLAAHQLKDGGEVTEVARAELESLARDGPLALRATLELTADAPRRWPAAPVPEERLVLRLWNDGVEPLGPQPTARHRLFEHLRNQVAAEAIDARVFVEWCTRENLAPEGLAWLDLQPAVINRSPLLLGVVADAAIATGDWTRLAAAVERGAWGPVSPELARDAIDYHRRKLSGITVAPGWRALLDRHQLSLPDLRALWRLAESWRLPVESDQALTAIVANFPRQRWAWELLEYRCRRNGDSEALWRHYAVWSKATPDDELLQMERLLLAYLTGRADVETKKQAGNLSPARRREPLGLAVRALALRADGQGAEALAVIAAAEGPVWHRSRLALVQGLLLAENGREADAQQVLPRVRGPLLPEERALLDAAWARVRK